MIDEAIGKILGMAMAYGASALGMLVAYVNYRKRIVKADKVMSPAAWGVIALSVLAVLGAVFVVSQIAAAPPEPSVVEEMVAPAPVVEPETQAEPPAVAVGEPKSWTIVGIVVPGLIFLFATWITAALHRHFSTQGHSQ